MLNQNKALNLVDQTKFDVNVFGGNLSFEDFQAMIQKEFGDQNNWANLYETYKVKGLIAAEPLLIATLVESCTKENCEDVLDQVLEMEEYKANKATLKRKVKQMLGVE